MVLWRRELLWSQARIRYSTLRYCATRTIVKPFERHQLERLCRARSTSHRSMRRIRCALHESLPRLARDVHHLPRPDDHQRTTQLRNVHRRPRHQHPGTSKAARVDQRRLRGRMGERSMDVARGGNHQLASCVSSLCSGMLLPWC